MPPPPSPPSKKELIMHKAIDLVAPPMKPLHYDNIYTATGNTLFLKSTFAPCSISKRHVATCPSLDAIFRGESPRISCENSML